MSFDKGKYLWNPNPKKTWSITTAPEQFLHCSNQFVSGLRAKSQKQPVPIR